MLVAFYFHDTFQQWEGGGVMTALLQTERRVFNHTIQDTILTGNFVCRYYGVAQSWWTVGSAAKLIEELDGILSTLPEDIETATIIPPIQPKKGAENLLSEHSCVLKCGRNITVRLYYRPILSLKPKQAVIIGGSAPAGVLCGHMETPLVFRAGVYDLLVDKHAQDGHHVYPETFTNTVTRAIGAFSILQPKYLYLFSKEEHRLLNLKENRSVRNFSRSLQNFTRGCYPQALVNNEQSIDLHNVVLEQLYASTMPPYPTVYEYDVQNIMNQAASLVCVWRR